MSIRVTLQRGNKRKTITLNNPKRPDKAPTQQHIKDGLRIALAKEKERVADLAEWKEDDPTPWRAEAIKMAFSHASGGVDQQYSRDLTLENLNDTLVEIGKQHWSEVVNNYFDIAWPDKPLTPKFHRRK